MRERSIQLHMPRADRPTCAHMIYAPVATAVGSLLKFCFLTF